MQSLQAEIEPFGIDTIRSIQASFALNFSLRSQQISQSGPLRTTTSAEQSKWNFGKATTVSSLATPLSSHGH